MNILNGKLLLSLMFAAAWPLAAQDTITVGAGSGNAGNTVNLTVSVRDVNGTLIGNDAGSGNRIQAIAFHVLFSPAGSVASAAFQRAGVLQSLTPLYERSVPSPNGFGYLASFSEAAQPIPFTSNAVAPGDTIGTLSITLASPTAGTNVAITLDPLTSALSNQAGTAVETTFNHGLKLNSGSIAVQGAVTSTALTASPNPSITGQSVTFAATVTSQGPGIMNGNVTFYDGTTALGSAPVLNQQATYSTATLTGGAHTITAAFLGGVGFLPSTSPAVTQQVNQGTVPPTGVTATALSTTAATVSWQPVPFAWYYEIRRSANLGAPYVYVGSTTSAIYTDTPLSPNKTYLYVVRTVNNQSLSSADSAPDPVTTTIFTNDPIVPGQTTVMRVHLTELRTAVNAFRACANLPPATFTDPAPDSSTPIRKIHIDELRAALLPARSALGLTTPTFTDSSITAQSTTIKAAHFQELRDAVK